MRDALMSITDKTTFLDRLESLNTEQFCRFCGAGVGEWKREGEGTCPKCDPLAVMERVMEGPRTT